MREYRGEVRYRYRDDIATADVAFEAWGESLEALFAAAADATVNVMVTDLETISPVVQRRMEAGPEAVDMLLFALLQELIFYKDAEQLLLRVGRVQISSSDALQTPPGSERGRGESAACSPQLATSPSFGQEDTLRLTAELCGELINPAKHDLIVDLKAVTLHRFKVEHTARGWEALVVLDI